MDNSYGRSLLLVGAIWIFGICPFIATAADIYVDDSNSTGVEIGTVTNPYTTLQEAIDEASSSSTTTIAVAAGTYTENILILEKEIVLQGGYSNNFTSSLPSVNITTIEGDGTDSVVTLYFSGRSVVDGFTITGGSGSAETLPDFYSGGGIYILGGAPVISNNIIEHNDITHSSATNPIELDAGSESQGGGIYTTYADTQILNNIIRYNSAGYGGGIKVAGENVTIRGNTINSNTGTNDHGGGIHADGPSLTISYNVIENNSIGTGVGYGQGGGVIVYGEDTTATLTMNVVRGNTAPNYGAGEFVDDGATAALKNELIYNNTLSEEDGIGAGIYIDGWGDGVVSNATIENVTVADNTCGTSTLGCGLAVDIYAQTVVSNSIFWGHNGLDFHVHGASSLTVNYTNSQQSYDGSGNITTDPLFNNSGSGDYHLKSKSGRWNPVSASWVIDTVHSPAIDAGSKHSTCSSEPPPNGNRINMGVFGNTDQASKSLSYGICRQFPWPTFLPAVTGRGSDR